MAWRQSSSAPAQEETAGWDALASFSATAPRGSGSLPVMLWLIATLVFLLLRVAPGDPVDAVLGSRAPAAAKAGACGPGSAWISLCWISTSATSRGSSTEIAGQALVSQEPVTEQSSCTLPASLELSADRVDRSRSDRPEHRLQRDRPPGREAGSLRAACTDSEPTPRQPFWGCHAGSAPVRRSTPSGWLPVGGRFLPAFCRLEGSGAPSARRHPQRRLAGPARSQFAI